MAQSTLSERLKQEWQALERPERRIRYLQKGGHAVWIVARTFFLIGMSFVLLYPLMMALSISFRTQADLLDPSVVWIPKHFTLENLKFTWNELEYPNSLLNTAMLSVVSSLLQVMSCAVVAYGFARFDFPLKNLCFALVIFTIIVPEQVLFIPKYLMFTDFNFLGVGWLSKLFTGEDINLLNNPLVMYLPALLGVGIRSGLFIFILNQFYRNLPRELEEAAYIDGCNAYSTFLRIVLPNARTSILTVFLFSIVWYWNDYFQASMYFVNMNTLSTMLARLSDTAVNFSSTLKSVTLQAGSLLLILPMLILFLCFERFFTEGLERSGIVG